MSVTCHFFEGKTKNLVLLRYFCSSKKRLREYITINNDATVKTAA